ncbi:type I glyceraldehyde-3-phosphate dehydrogenase [Megasphaera vaginalis (ex Bordigoni et al. 2020)]|uniref:type I glyceraldehyde-3-phosphate dehydrogenase n=1 Tax=Megasphaera vaginalis (ex Bordigoni et al. 2020) TaxID=2045301 RepID=UPI000C7DD82D|nr:type I glyceraldehyde-3-phosphate dehydrogenase [Megasphaera vaginalis (ex Bordigoni et al. 2020)]
MAVKIGISGFGRIGRCTFRTALLHPEVEIAALNNRSVGPIMADLLKFDTVHGTWDHDVSFDSERQCLLVDGRSIPVTNETDPANIPWKTLGVDIVVESTGKFKDHASASKHLAGGAKKVIITAPGKEPDATIVMGVNEETYDPATHHIISNGSCTTNCLAPIAKVLSSEFGIVRGMMTTVHSYTNDQHLVDSVHKDLRRARCATQAIIPTSTGAAQAVALVLPELKGKFTGMALRVPTPNVSMTDLVAVLGKKVTKEAVNQALKKWADGPLKGILAYSEDATVSSDYISDTHSSIVDALDTRVVGEDMVKVVAWYDNEWGYSLRVNDLAAYIASKGV